MEKILSISNLEKSYKEHKVIKDISFDVYEQEILCILGPNGAGKSTTINILCGALGYESGEIKWKGKRIEDNIMQFKGQLGIVPQDISLYDDLSTLQNIHFFASLYGLRGEDLKRKCLDALAFVGLSEHANDKVNTFSGGMKRRLNIACAIAHQPSLLIMDEPTVGIDPQSRNHILNSIKDLRENGMSIIYTTHYMEEVEEISTRIIIMDNGIVIAEGSKEILKEKTGDERQFIITVDQSNNIDENQLYKIEGIKKTEIENETLTITTLKSVENLDRIIGMLLNCDIKINNISCQTASLETVFLGLTGKSLRD